MKKKDDNIITKEVYDLYKKDVEQLSANFNYEINHQKNTIEKLQNELNSVYSSKAWKLVQKYREFIVSLKPKKDISKTIENNHIEFVKENKDKPLIAYIIPGCEMSGGIAVVCQHLNRLKKRGYNVLMITEYIDTKIDWFPNQDVEIVTIDNCPTNIDILVATSWTTAYTLEKINAKEKYYFVQSDETRFFKSGAKEIELARNTYKMNVKFITEAKWIQKWLKDNFGKDAYYVPNGIDTDFMYPTLDRYNKDRKKRVLLEGAIDIPYKGMEDAFKAVEGLDCEVWCVSSSGQPKSEWKCDKFFQRVPISGMNFIYSQCDVLLKMSRVEGFFGPPMEMMACKGTCVVGKVSGYDEYIVDGENALVVEQGDVESAHKALEKLLSDDELREKLSNNGYETALQWNWEDSIDKLENIFSKGEE